MRVRLIAVAGLALGLSAAVFAEVKDSEQKEKAAEPAKQELKEGEFVKQTPFGPMKQGPPKKVDKLSGAQFVEVEEQGDLVIFRRSTPFGPQVWKTKRSDLSDVEKDLLEHQRRRSKEKAGAGERAGDSKNDSSTRTNQNKK